MARESPAKHKYIKLDSYVPNTEIVSRKYAQFNEVSEETAIVRQKNDNESLERLTLLIHDPKSVIYTSVQTTK